MGRCWVMVWEGLVYKVLRISLGKYEDCNDSQVLCPEVRRWWIAWGLKEELAGLIGHEVWGRLRLYDVRVGYVGWIAGRMGCELLMGVW